MSEKAESTATIVPKKRRPRDSEIDITPMIDIVFLLLAFFVVVSKMDSAAPIKMPRAKHGDAVRDASCVVLMVKESPTDLPWVFLGKSMKEGDALRGSNEDIADQITQYVETELRNNAEKTMVLIKAERKVKSRHVSMVKTAVSGALDIEAGHRIFVGIDEE